MVLGASQLLPGTAWGAEIVQRDGAGSSGPAGPGFTPVQGTTLTWLPVLLPGFQHRQLPHQQGDVLQQVPVGQEELPDPGLRFDSRRCFRRQLVLEQLHLRTGRADRERRRSSAPCRPRRGTEPGVQVVLLPLR